MKRDLSETHSLFFLRQIFCENTLLRYLHPGKDLGLQYVSEMIKAARTELCGRKEDNVKLLPTLARLLKEGGHSTKVEFWGDICRVLSEIRWKKRTTALYAAHRIIN